MRGALVALRALGAMAVLVGCTEVGTGPSEVVAIELHEPQLPALTAGDTLRDTTGMPAPLVAIAFNGMGDTVVDAPFRFLVLDTGIVAVDSATGLVTGRDTTGDARVLVGVGALQSAPITLHVTLAPDTLTTAGLQHDTLHFTAGVDSGRTLQVTLSHDPTPGVAGDPLVPVANYLVRFSIVAPGDVPPGDTTGVLLVSSGHRASGVDTTDAQGIASRQLLVPSSLTSFPPDSVVVDVTAVEQTRDRRPVPGSPIRFVVHIRAAGG
jgi:hypothetical protein